MPFQVERRPELRACIVSVEGDIDLSMVPDLEEALGGAVSAGLSNVVMDMSAVTYVDSSALGMLIWLDKELKDTGGKVMLAGADENVSRILELSGLISVANSVSTQSSAEHALQSLEVVAIEGEPLWTRELTLSAGVQHLAQVREEVSVILADLGFSEAALFDIKVALGEALANAVRHGSPEGVESEIEVHVRVFDKHVALDVLDRGSGFDGVHPGSDDLYASGGRGIMFMRALLDQVVFSRGAGGGTVVTLIKHRAPVEVQ